MYTDYDRLLKSHSYLDARAIVQPYTLDKIIEWRDEKDEPDAVEDILREVIVISDDEDEVSDEDDLVDRESSIEILSSRDITNGVHVQPLDYSILDDRSRYERQMSPEDTWATGAKYIRRLVTPPETARRRQNRIDRQQAHRNRVWQEALSRRRNPTDAVRDKAAEPPMNNLHNEVDTDSNSRRPTQPVHAGRSTYEPWPKITESRPKYMSSETDPPLVVANDRQQNRDRCDVCCSYLGSRFLFHKPGD